MTHVTTSTLTPDRRDSATARGLLAAAEAVDLAPEYVQLALELAARTPDLDDDERRALVLLVTATLGATRTGSTLLSVRGDDGVFRAVVEAWVDTSGEGSLFETEELMETARTLLRDDRIAHLVTPSLDESRPLVRLGDDAVASWRLARLERDVGGAIGTLLRSADADAPEEVGAALDDVVARAPATGGAPLDLTDEQRTAVAVAARRRLAVVSGGPGTGKTSIVVSLLRVLVRRGLAPEDIAVAAPTGKAAHRLDASIRATLEGIGEPSREDHSLLGELTPARTLHRLLGWRPWGFTRHANDPLRERVVVVDEASMVDLSLMDRLLRALPEGGRLVLLGDAGQLPSVEAGAVLRDLLPPDEADPDDPRRGATVTLHRSFRMREEESHGAAILRAARVVAEGGDPLDGALTERASADEVGFSGAEWLPPRRDAFLERWVAALGEDDEPVCELATRIVSWGEDGIGDGDRERILAAAAHRAASRILSPTRVGPTGVFALNDAVRALRARRLGLPGRDLPWWPGEPVMMLRNDYRRGIFNGDAGLVILLRRPGSGPRPTAAFERDGELVLVDLASAGGVIEPAWATTVHKSQGSEFDRVAVILPDEDGPMMTREILYTAMTRARTSVTLVGPAAIIRAAAGRRLVRHGGLALD